MNTSFSWKGKESEICEYVFLLLLSTQVSVSSSIKNVQITCLKPAHLQISRWGNDFQKCRFFELYQSV
jgi:hypothetical protein